MHMSPKENNSPSCGSSNPSQIQRKFFVEKHFEANGRLFVLQNLTSDDLATLEHRRMVNSEWYTTIGLPLEKFEKRTRQDESLFTMVMRASAQIGAFLTGQKVRRAANLHPMTSLDSRTSRKTAWSSIFVTRRYCWSVQKPYFEDISIGVEKQPKIMVVRQNILNTIMQKNVKLSYEYVRFHLATPEIC